MILTEFIHVKNNGMNHKRYTELGCKLENGYFTVSPEQLAPRSLHKILIKCDTCGHIREVTNDRYSMQVDKTTCNLCNKSAKKTWIDVFTVFSDKGYTLCSNTYYHAHQLLTYFCNKHNHTLQRISYANIQQNHGCYYCASERKIGELNCSWKGGTSPILGFLRKNITDWKLESGKLHNYRCVISGKNRYQVHHLNSFNIIVKDTFCNNNIVFKKTIDEYTQEELAIILELFLTNHNKEPMGVCLSEELHNEYHTAYGKSNNSVEQFKEFYFNKTGNVYVPKYREDN